MSISKAATRSNNIEELFRLIEVGANLEETGGGSAGGTVVGSGCSALHGLTAVKDLIASGVDVNAVPTFFLLLGCT